MHRSLHFLGKKSYSFEHTKTANVDSDKLIKVYLSISACILGHACNKFGYYEHSAITSSFFLRKLIPILKKFIYHLKWIKLLVLNGTQCTFLMH